VAAKELVALNGETIPTDIAPSGKKTIAYYKRVPVGVVACITPFNFPLNLVAHKIAPALGAGNSVVLKPTPEAPLTAYKLAKLFINSRYAIKDALSVVYGDAEVGSTLVSSQIPRVISFTGSVPVGHIITREAGIKKVSLELGGNAATIYLINSADLEYTAKRCVLLGRLRKLRGPSLAFPLSKAILCGMLITLHDVCRTLLTQGRKTPSGILTQVWVPPLIDWTDTLFHWGPSFLHFPGTPFNLRAKAWASKGAQYRHKETSNLSFARRGTSAKLEKGGTFGPPHNFF